MTFEEERRRAICQMLGLDPCWKPEPDLMRIGRGVGKTTRMLLVALEHVMDGKPVSISAHEARYTDELVGRLRDWARRVGADPSLIRPLYRRGEHNAGCRDERQRQFVDHAVWDVSRPPYNWQVRHIPAEDDDA